jgi:hypothetical protein
MKRLIGILSLLVLCGFVVIASEVTTNFIVSESSPEVANYVPPCVFGNSYISYAVVVSVALIVAYVIWRMGTGEMVFGKRRGQKRR